MNELQKVEFGLLKIFCRICEELNLQYFMVCGTALGAVKYGGFIPWDDDVDVALPRSDYERFLKEAPALLPDDVFLQNYRTDSAFPMMMTKLRASNTTYIETDKEMLPINHGVFLDVFPLDGYPDKKWEQSSLEYKKTVANWKCTCVLQYPKHYHRVRVRGWLFRQLRYHEKTAKVLAKLERDLSKYDIETSAIWCNHGNSQGKLDYAPRWHYGDGIWTCFEGLRVRIPENYDAYLSQKYGDWRAELPEEKKKGHHYYTVLDVEKPYTHYTNKI